VQVDVRALGATVNLGFAFHDSPFTFEANVGSSVLAAQASAPQPDHVALTDRARLLLTEKGLTFPKAGKIGSVGRRCRDMNEPTRIAVARCFA
jgi:hypothetical protein